MREWARMVLRWAKVKGGYRPPEIEAMEHRLRHFEFWVPVSLDEFTWLTGLTPPQHSDVGACSVCPAAAERGIRRALARYIKCGDPVGAPEKGEPK